MAFFMGIDDAGRGPLIGAMLMAGVLVNEDGQKKLKKIGCKDSKQLTRAQREGLFGKIQEISEGHHIVATSPTEIDGRASVGLDLNKLEAIKTATIINALLEQFEEKLKGEKINVVVDCPSPNTESWKNYLKGHIKFTNINLKCEHKADVNHVECSAASILAKVTRDNEIDKIKESIGIDFGSGYPSDPQTIEFLEKHTKEFKNHGIFRKTWGTWNEHIVKKEQKKLDGF
jgi:ribonuclease HII